MKTALAELGAKNLAEIERAAEMPFPRGKGAGVRETYSDGELVNETRAVCNGRGAVTSDGAPIEDDAAGYFAGPFCDLDGRY